MGSVAFCGSQCTNAEQDGGQSHIGSISRKIGIRSQAMQADLDNYVDPKSIDDTFERVKFEYPFYRTDITNFGNRLDELSSMDDMKANELNTHFISIQDVKQTLCVTKAWKD